MAPGHKDLCGAIGNGLEFKINSACQRAPTMHNLQLVSKDPFELSLNVKNDGTCLKCQGLDYCSLDLALAVQSDKFQGKCSVSDSDVGSARMKRTESDFSETNTYDRFSDSHKLEGHGQVYLGSMHKEKTEAPRVQWFARELIGTVGSSMKHVLHESHWNVGLSNVLVPIKRHDCDVALDLQLKLPNRPVGYFEWTCTSSSEEQSSAAKKTYLSLALAGDTEVVTLAEEYKTLEGCEMDSRKVEVNSLGSVDSTYVRSGQCKESSEKISGAEGFSDVISSGTGLKLLPHEYSQHDDKFCEGYQLKLDNGCETSYSSEVTNRVCEKIMFDLNSEPVLDDDDKSFVNAWEEYQVKLVDGLQTSSSTAATETTDCVRERIIIDLNSEPVVDDETEVFANANKQENADTKMQSNAHGIIHEQVDIFSRVSLPVSKDLPQSEEMPCLSFTPKDANTVASETFDFITDSLVSEQKNVRSPDGKSDSCGLVSDFATEPVALDAKEPKFADDEIGRFPESDVESLNMSTMILEADSYDKMNKFDIYHFAVGARDLVLEDGEIEATVELQGYSKEEDKKQSSSRRSADTLDTLDIPITVLPNLYGEVADRNGLHGEHRELKSSDLQGETHANWKGAPGTLCPGDISIMMPSHENVEEKTWQISTEEKSVHGSMGFDSGLLNAKTRPDMVMSRNLHGSPVVASPFAENGIPTPTKSTPEAETEYQMNNQGFKHKKIRRKHHKTTQERSQGGLGRLHERVVAGRVKNESGKNKHYWTGKLKSSPDGDLSDELDFGPSKLVARELHEYSDAISKVSEINVENVNIRTKIIEADSYTKMNMSDSSPCVVAKDSILEDGEIEETLELQGNIDEGEGNSSVKNQVPDYKKLERGCCKRKSLEHSQGELGRLRQQSIVTRTGLLPVNYNASSRPNSGLVMIQKGSGWNTVNPTESLSNAPGVAFSQNKKGGCSAWPMPSPNSRSMLTDGVLRRDKRHCQERRDENCTRTGSTSGYAQQNCEPVYVPETVFVPPGYQLPFPVYFPGVVARGSGMNRFRSGCSYQRWNRPRQLGGVGVRQGNFREELHSFGSNNSQGKAKRS